MDAKEDIRVQMPWVFLDVSPRERETERVFAAAEAAMQARVPVAARSWDVRRIGRKGTERRQSGERGSRDAEGQ